MPSSRQEASRLPGGEVLRRLTGPPTRVCLCQCTYSSVSWDSLQAGVHLHLLLILSASRPHCFSLRLVYLCSDVRKPVQIAELLSTDMLTGDTVEAFLIGTHTAKTRLRGQKDQGCSCLMVQTSKLDALPLDSMAQVLSNSPRFSSRQLNLLGAQSRLATAALMCHNQMGLALSPASIGQGRGRWSSGIEHRPSSDLKELTNSQVAGSFGDWPWLGPGACRVTVRAEELPWLMEERRCLTTACSHRACCPSRTDMRERAQQL